jgi:hypothetical protein
MRKAFHNFALLILVAVVLLATAAARQSSTDKKSEATTTKAPIPGPEMDRLKFLVGTWDTIGGYEKSSMFPEGGKQLGWYKARLGPGGFSIIAEFEAEGPLGKEIGHQVIAWDPKQNAYQVVTAGNAFPGVIIGTSQWEGSSLVTRWDLNLDENMFHSRSTYSTMANNSLHMEEFIQSGDAPEQLIWKADATKK